jgi:uncharacterized damage-inducible protein DinB
MRATSIIVLFVFLMSGSAGLAEEPPAAAAQNPYTEHTRGIYEALQKIMITSAELMPEEKYGFKPVESVRSFGEILGHAASSQYYMCATVLGEKPAPPKLDASTATKAELIAALRGAFAYCDSAWSTMTDASGAEIVTFMNEDSPKLGVLSVNNVHTIEHYGNLIVYLRMNGLVPPTSDPEFMKKLSER